MFRHFINPAFFGVILLCFFMPFCSIRCNGFKLYSFSGAQLATGTVVQPVGGNGMFGSITGSQMDDEISADRKAQPLSEFSLPLLITLFITMAALVLTIFRRLPVYVIGLIASAVILILVITESFILQSELKEKMPQQSSAGGMFGNFYSNVSLDTDIGFWMMALFAFGLVVFNIVSLTMKNEPPAPPNYPTGPYQYPPPGYPPVQNYPPGQNYP